MATTTRLLTAVFACLILTACGGVAELPPPAAVEDRAHVDLDRVAGEEAEADRFAEARRAILALYDALAREDFAAVYEGLSHETRALLDSLSNNDGVGLLQSEVLTQDGQRYSFETADLLLLSSVDEITDDTEGEPAVESARRKEIDLINSEGSRRRVILIFEGDSWRLHMPRIPTTLLTAMSDG